MRNAGLALALVASAQLTVLSSPAFAQDDSKAAGQAPSETTTESTSLSSKGTSSTGTAGASTGTASASTGGDSTSPAPGDAKQKEKTGWIVLAAGGVGFVTGVVFDIIGGFSGNMPGTGGPGDTQETSNARPAWVFAGTTLIVAGLAAGIYGTSMIVSARKGTDSTNSTRPEGDAASNDSVTKAAQARAASAPSVVVPILGGTF
jgi:hypothetical protein